MSLSLSHNDEPNSGGKAALVALDTFLRDATRHMAARIAQTDASADDYQNACYELAFAAAELAAANALFEEAEGQGDTLSNDLARSYAASVMPQVILRLRVIAGDIEMQSDALNGLDAVFIADASAKNLQKLGADILA